MTLSSRSSNIKCGGTYSSTTWSGETSSSSGNHRTLPDNPLQLQQNATTQAAESTITAARPLHTSSASKIPFRPRKTRKVSGDFSIDNSENKAPQAVDGDNATPTPLSNATAGNKKNTRGNKTTAIATAISATVTTTAVVNNDSRIIVQPIRVIPRIVGKTLSCEGEVAAAIRHLRAADPQLARVIDVHQPPSFDTFHPPFLALTKSILYQQLAYKAGTSIYTRFVALCGGEAGVIPDAVLSLSVHQLRQIGVSARKASYLHDLASKYRKGILSDSSIIDMDDKSLFAMLTMVKGIGSWSVHMFMIFSLHRPDVLPVGDLGVRKGVQLLYDLEQLPRPSQMEQLCEKWKPYRSVGAWYMWRFAEAKGTQASAAAVAVGASPPQSLQQQQLQQPPLQLQSQQQQQHQLLDPINGIASLGIAVAISVATRFDLISDLLAVSAVDQVKLTVTEMQISMKTDLHQQVNKLMLAAVREEQYISSSYVAGQIRSESEQY
ncbi:hypothetical protein NE237_022527 [Protea cynaroides]|uniref:HhH-GPD domain-containing protein n=1 Tax=Protea cynaroides TaxID=273540 RepID=A0A9Q0HD74_9MAGN|nr:hypothetical protein NE237_022527 [Protea cynaroides]